MAEKRIIKVGIVGYGNVARGVEKALAKTPDMELEAIFTRRNPSEVVSLSGARVAPYKNMYKYQDIIDVMILCGGSKDDLPKQGPEIASMFNIVDSFDTHARVPEYFENVDKAAYEADTVAIISTGWDPGMFSLNRVYADAILPGGYTQTFWGPGVSQGHSDAIRRIKGVKDARQYTIPVDSTVERIRNGETPELTAREKHTRLCYVVAEDGADTASIEEEIKSMPNYFADYDTTVVFISEEEMMEKHSEMPHAGTVLHSAVTGDGHKQRIEYSLSLDSNPEFTGSIMVAYARAAYRMWGECDHGAKTVLDIPPAMLSPKSRGELLTTMI